MSCVNSLETVEKDLEQCFADEAVFIQAEATTYSDLMALTAEEGKRNTISFAYPGISYDRSIQ